MEPPGKNNKTDKRAFGLFFFFLQSCVIIHQDKHIILLRKQKGEGILNKKNFKSLLLVLAMIMLLNSITVSYAETLKELKAQQNTIKEEIENTKEQLKELETRSNTIENQIKELDLKVASAASELLEVEKELEIINLNIDENEKQLKTAEENIIEKTEIFEQRLRVMYKSGNTGYLEVLLSSKDIKDFLSRQNMVESIAKQDQELIRFMKEQRDIIEEKKIELQAQRASVESTKNKIKERKEKLEASTREKELLMSRLEQDVKSFEKEYDKLNDLAKSVEKEIVKLQSAAGEYTGGIMQWPVPGRSRISSPFGYRIHPIFKVKKMHTGIDIPAPTGNNIVAAAAGKVIYSGWLGGYGNVIMIDHGGKIVTLYAHNSALLAREGAVVGRGDVVAKAGSTGNSTGPHLHFEVRKNGSYVDPIPWLKGN